LRILDAVDTPEPEAGHERRTLRWLGFALTAAALGLVFELWPWLLLAVWTASAVKPFASGLARRAGGRPTAAAITTIGLLMGLLVPLGAGVAVLIPDVIDLAERARGAGSGSKSLSELVSRRSEGEAKEHSPASAKPEHLVDVAREHGQQAMDIARPLAGALASFALGVLVYFVAVYASLLHGEQAYAWLRERSPLSSGSTDRLRDTYQEVGHGLLYSVGLTALLQGGLAAIAYVALGVPRALALGLATIVTSLIPAIGPFLIWGPVALGLYLAGHPIKAAILAGVGVVIVAPADNLLRPLLAKRGKLQLHPFLVFFAMVGGIALIGGWGLMVGPLVFRMARELIDMLHERRASEEPA
jgi:predicted PurR-regulated permease PerM